MTLSSLIERLERDFGKVEANQLVRLSRGESIASSDRASAARGQVTKIKNRVGHGVCPCCNRTFSDLARHMNSKHPTFTAEAAE